MEIAQIAKLIQQQTIEIKGLPATSSQINATLKKLQELPSISRADILAVSGVKFPSIVWNPDPDPLQPKS